MSSRFKTPVLPFSLGLVLGILLFSPESPELREKSVQPAPKPKSLIQVTSSEPLKWSQLQSADLSMYVSHLRRIKCPEDLVEAIVRADIEFSYLSKSLALNHPTNFVADPFDRISARSAELKRLEAEIDAILYDKLRIERPITDSALFSAQEERQILEAAKAFPKFAPDPTNPESTSLAQSNKLRRIEYLARYLPSEDLLYYKLDREREAPKIAYLLRGLQPTKTEFLAAYSATEGKNLTGRTGHFDATVDSALRDALGEARYHQLVRLNEPDCARILDFAALYGLSSQVQNQLVDLHARIPDSTTNAYLNALTNILRRPSLIASYLSQTQRKY